MPQAKHSPAKQGQPCCKVCPCEEKFVGSSALSLQAALPCKCSTASQAQQPYCWKESSDLQARVSQGDKESAAAQCRKQSSADGLLHAHSTPTAQTVESAGISLTIRYPNPNANPKISAAFLTLTSTLRYPYPNPKISAVQHAPLGMSGRQHHASKA